MAMKIGDNETATKTGNVETDVVKEQKMMTKDL